MEQNTEQPFEKYPELAEVIYWLSSNVKCPIGRWSKLLYEINKLATATQPPSAPGGMPKTEPVIDDEDMQEWEKESAPGVEEKYVDDWQDAKMFTNEEVLDLLAEFAIAYHKSNNKDLTNDAAEYLADKSKGRPYGAASTTQGAVSQAVQDIQLTDIDGPVFTHSALFRSHFDYIKQKVVEILSKDESTPSKEDAEIQRRNKIIEDNLKLGMRLNMPGISEQEQESTWQEFKKRNDL